MSTPLPLPLLQSLEGLPGFDRDAFEATHAHNKPVTSIRVNPAKWPNGIPEGHWNGAYTSVPWTRWGYYLPQRPSFTFDPFFHAGCYYVQEASSMALEQALQQHTDLAQPLRVLDLSAAPGGKTTHLQSLLSKDSLLVSNEVIRNRCWVLADNVQKWGAENVVVTNNDPAHFQKLPGFFDVIVVDAPCSGSGLFRKDPEAIEEWSLHNVALCSQRQQRILADVLPALKSGGLLVYSTCSYSAEEDEAICDWLVQELHLQAQPISFAEETGIVATQAPDSGAWGYRFYPHRLQGEGFFLAAFTKEESSGETKAKRIKWEPASPGEKTAVQAWLGEDRLLVKDKDFLYALPRQLSEDLALLQQTMHVVYKGIKVGQVMKNKLVPDHALALSTVLRHDVPTTGLDYAQAIQYLQRADLQLHTVQTGWQAVAYQNQRLGWINALSNRINNYYPRELRILKQSNDAPFKNL